MVGATKGTSFSKGTMEELVLFYVYLFPCKIKVDIQDILGMRKLLTLIPHLIPPSQKMHLYKYEILLEVLLKIMLLIFHGNLVCFNIFGEGGSNICMPCKFLLFQWCY